VILVASGLEAFWALLSGISSFRLLAEDGSRNIPHLRTIALILGIMYMVGFVIEVFGIIAALMQRVVMVRIYAFLSILTSVLILGGKLTQVIIHFTMKNDLINECARETTGDTVYFTWGLFGPTQRTTLNPGDALNWCRSTYDHDSWADPLGFVLDILISILFVMIAFAYYKQVVDPTSPVNSSRVPSNMFRSEGYPQQYNPPYAGGSFYPPPPGPPPTQGYYDPSFAPPYDGNKPPEYGNREGDAKYSGDIKDGVKEDPFADFDGLGKVQDVSYGERDVTTGPRPGERETF